LDSLPQSQTNECQSIPPTTRQPTVSKQISPALSFAKTISGQSYDPDQADQALISVDAKYRATWTACRKVKPVKANEFPPTKRASRNLANKIARLLRLAKFRADQETALNLS
jgi:hypothetical protein